MIGFKLGSHLKLKVKLDYNFYMWKIGKPIVLTIIIKCLKIDVAEMRFFGGQIF